MLTVQHLSKTYGIQTILDEVSFNVNAGERLGLVGPNGCGKTTLVRILAQEEKPDRGTIHFVPSDLRVGYLPQGFEFSADDTVSSFIDRMEGNLLELTMRLQELAELLVKTPDGPGLQAEYDHVLANLEVASEGAGRGPAVLAALGLDTLASDTPASHLSGGQKTRLALAGVLLSNPQLLLLDEPTNHLDFSMLEWLENWLLSFRGAVLMVSHDRAFLDGAATGILDLDPNTHTIRQYVGNYSDYLEQKLAERDHQWQEFSDQQEEIVKLKNAARHLRGLAKFRKGGKADTGDKFAKGFFANRGQGTMGRAKHMEQRLERLLTEDRVDKPRENWQMKIEFGDTPASGRDVVTLDRLSIGYGDHMLVEGIDEQIRFGARVALVGPNGAGKTTLVRTIAGLIEPLAGRARLGSRVKIGYMAQEQEELDPALNSLETIRRTASYSETDARAFLSMFLFKGDDVFVPVGKLSYGERARLSLSCLVAQGCNLLLLDEPVNHLDIPSRARFEQALAAFQGTILAVVHDRYFIESFATEIWEVKDKHLNKVAERV